MEKPVIPSSLLTDLEVAAKQDMVILHVQDGESANPVVLLASRVTLTAQSSVLAARLAEVAPDEARLQVAAPPVTFERLYAMMHAIAMTAGGAASQSGVHEYTMVLITSADLADTLPLAVRFGAAGVVGCLVESVQQAPSMDGIGAVDKWVPDDGPFGGFEWRPRAVDLLVKQCISCSWARSDNRTYFKIEDYDGGAGYRQRIKAGGALTIPRQHLHTFNWQGWEGGPRRARTLQVLLDRVWLSNSVCGLTRD